jgi:tetratricopeptide (TPR) repeat protein
MSTFDKQVNRNLKGKELEKKGNLEDAILLYEENVKEYFEGDYPYDRLVVIYHKQREFQKEREVLEKAIYVFEKVVYAERTDRLPKLEKFKKRLSRL